MPIVTPAAPSRLRLLPVLLMACVVTLCLTGLARPAMAMPSTAMSEMPGPMESMGMGNLPGGMHSAHTGQSLSVSDAHSLQQPCPMSSMSDCAQPSVSPLGSEQTACTNGFDRPAPAFMQPGPPRSGVPPPLEPPSPPELTRLCVSRT
ncbi:hypothetical protein DEJ46_06445 [Streptomyces venezuelae]|uniref:Uncharacterized protein n=1 Tax=Streptomyces venezuelae TaxID=54571 RepID=A0A5P2AMF0_STRVZ|nr:hypothetical protein DEJ46_06445 [Streptomyces venezuelae]